MSATYTRDAMIDFSSLYAPDSEEYLPFQKAGIVELSLRPHILLADEMGLGKTIQVLGYINYARPPRVLIICPNNLRLNWLTEIDKWLEPSLRETYEIEQCTPSLYIPGATLVVASYEGAVRWANTLRGNTARIEDRQNPKDGDSLGTNRSSSPGKAMVIATAPGLFSWDLLVVDEAHYIKNSSTKRYRAVADLRDVVAKRVLLTGTPICNYPYEIFPLIQFLDVRQWPSKAAFERRYCPYQNKYGYHLSELQDFLRNGTTQKVMRKIQKREASVVKSSTHGAYTCEVCTELYESAAVAQNHVIESGHSVRAHSEAIERIVPTQIIEIEEAVDEQLPGLMVRRLKKEVLPELPRKRRQIIELPAEGELLNLVEEENKLWQTQAEIIRQLEEALTGIKQEAVDDNDFSKIIDGLKFNKRYFFDEIAIIRHKLALAKVPYIQDHIEDLLESKDKLVCFVHHNDVGRAILDKFADKAVHVYGATSMEDRAAAIKKFWDDDKCELFIGSLKVTGLGINLQIASNIVFAELDWVPGVITQAEDRCHRIGQEKSLLVQHLVAQNSMDSNMAKRIVSKQKSIQKALNRQETTSNA